MIRKHQIKSKSPDKPRGDKNDEEVYIDPDQPVYTTGVICRLINIPVWTLRKLDVEGIVNPHRNSEKQSRLYSHNQLKKLQKCWYFMQKNNVKIPGSRVILEIEERKTKKFFISKLAV